jgi:hypothetical protein
MMYALELINLMKNVVAMQFTANDVCVNPLLNKVTAGWKQTAILHHYTKYD